MRRVSEGFILDKRMGSGARAKRRGKKRQPNFWFSANKLRGPESEGKKKWVGYPHPNKRSASSKARRRKSGRNRAASQRKNLRFVAEMGAEGRSGERWRFGTLAFLLTYHLEFEHPARICRLVGSRPLRQFHIPDWPSR